MSKIFEEAIADAKKLKEVAEKNAKDAIIESITPKIRSFIENEIISQNTEENVESYNPEHFEKLFEMLGVNSQKKDYATQALNNLSESNQSEIKNLLKKINQNINTLERKEINNKELNFKEQNMEKFYEVDLKALRESVEKEADDLSAMEELKDDMKEMGDMYDEDDDSMDEMGDMYEDDDSMDEMDMDEMYEEDSEDMMSEQDDFVDLEEPSEEESEEDSEDMEAAEMGGGDSISKSEVEAQIQELIADLGLEIGGEPGAEMEAPDLEEPSEEESEEALDEMFDIDPNMLREELANIRKSLNEGKVDHHFGGKGGGKAGVKGAYGGTGPKKHGYQKAFGGGSPGKDVFVTPPTTLKKLNEARKMLQKLSRMNRSQNEKLNKYRSAVQTLREQLEELNLFNAKLLYVNKLLQNDNINESQKKSVIKALDEAKSLTEAKALYKSLTETFHSKKKSLNESTRFGSSSRTTSSASSSSTKAIGEMSRWQRLAGLK